jgi:protein MpaA
VAKPSRTGSRSSAPPEVIGVTSYDALAEGWARLCGREGVRLREIPCVGADRTLLLVDFGPPDAPRVHITSGVHGDEPAGPWALLSLAASGLLDDRFAYRIWPCTNPSGYRAGTRLNAEGQDVNRSFSDQGTTPESRAILAANHGHRFALALDLHEDYEADGFYCYEPVIDGAAPLSQAILHAIETSGFPLQSLDHLFDLGYPTDPRKAAKLRTLERGRVLVNAEAEIRFFPGLPLSLRLLRSAARRYVTIETPRRRPWADRIAMHRTAVVAALAEAASIGAKERGRNA